MASVYILYSKKIDSYYTGSCAEISFRLSQHLGKAFVGSYTTKADDWDLFIVIEALEYRQARLIEAHIKRMKSKVYINNLRRYP